MTNRLCRNAFAPCLAVLCAAMVVLLHSTSFAQGRFAKIAQFSDPIGCGFFFNEAQGFIGTGIRPLAYRGRITPSPRIQIFRTTDGGQNWQAMVTPVNYGAVTMIHMTDSLNGYASIFSDGSVSRRAVWHTIDGGRTWVDDIDYLGLGTAIHATSKVLLVNDWDQSWYGGPDLPGVGISTNNGASWLRYFPSQADGVAFSDDNMGVVSFLGGLGAQTWYRTTDGGLGWQPTTPQYEAWSIHALENSSIFLCANESQYYQPHTSVNWSTDGGATWSTRYQFNNIRFTGHITGKGPTIYLQTDTAAYGAAEQPYLYGVYRSDDTGRTWRAVGGPANNRDTRAIVATGCSGEVVYAFDASGGVYKSTQGGDGTLTGGGSPQYAKMSVSADSVRLVTLGCRDSVVVSVFSEGCASFLIDSLMPLHSPLLKGVKLTNSVVLANGDSANFTIRFDPTDNTPITDTLRAYGHAGNRIITKDIVIRAARNLPIELSLSRNTITLFAPDCSTVTDSLFFLSTNCRTVRIDSIVYSDAELRGIALTDATTQGATLHLGYQPDSAGSHTTIIRIYGRCEGEAFDTTVTLILRSDLHHSQFSITSDSLAALSVRCEEATLSLLFRNSGCTDIVVDSIRSAYQNFTPIHLIASTLKPGSEDSLTWVFRPSDNGEHRDTIRIYAHSGGVAFDTTIYLNGFNVASSPLLTLAADSLRMTTSACREALDAVLMHNLSCEELWIDSMSVGGSEFSSTLPLPASVLSGDSLSLPLRFVPDSGGVRSGQVVLHCHNAAGRFDTLIYLTAENIIAPEVLALSLPELPLSTAYCQPTEQPLRIYNQGCTQMFVDSVRIEGDLLGEFRLIAVQQNINPLDSTLLRFGFTPNERGGRSATARIFLHSGTKTFDTIIALSGYNQTAPEPQIAAIASVLPGEQTSITVTLRPTDDRFAIPLVHARINMNTDLLTPLGVSLESTLCSGGRVTSFVADRDGASVTIELPNPITEANDLTLPLFRMICEGKLSRDSSTMVALDSFSITPTATLPLCQIPSAEFVMNMACGDQLIQTYLRGGSLAMKLLSVVPNPADHRGVEVSFTCATPSSIRAEWIDVAGNVARTEQFDAKSGTNKTRLAAPSVSGEYILRLRSPLGEVTSKVVVQR